MTREEELDWLCRLRSEIYVYMPKEWLIPMNNALDMAISALSENKGEWIPCREREPHGFSFVALDEFNNYPWVCNSLFTWEDKDGVKHFYDATGYQDTILQGGVKAFLRGKKMQTVGGRTIYVQPPEIVAWMPLPRWMDYKPEPYKAER